jgi:hypothetical protein
VDLLNPDGSIRTTTLTDGDPAAPAITADGSILFATTHGVLYSLSSSGNKLWQVAIATHDGAFLPSAVIPVCSGEALLVLGDPTLHSDTLLDVNTQNGQTNWSLPSNAGGPPLASVTGAYYAGDTIAVHSDGTPWWSALFSGGVESISSSGDLVGWTGERKADGTFKWSFEARTGGVGLTVMSDDSIRFADGRDLISFDSMGNRQWIFQPSWGGDFHSWHMARPILAGDGTAIVLLAAANHDDEGPIETHLMAVDAEGRGVWDLRLDRPCIPGSVVLAGDGLLYVACGAAILAIGD